MSVNYIDILVSNTEKRESQDKKFNWWLHPFLTTIPMVVAGLSLIAFNPFLGLHLLPYYNRILSFFKFFIFSFLLPIGMMFSMFLHSVYIRAKRVNNFIRRKNEWYETIVEYTGRFGRNQDSLRKLEDFMDEEVNVTPKKINYIQLTSLVIIIIFGNIFIAYDYPEGPIILLLLIFLGLTAYWGHKFDKVNEAQAIVEIPIKETLFCCVFILFYNGYYTALYQRPITYLWDKLQKREKKFCDLINEIWIEEGWMTEEIDPSKQRSGDEWDRKTLKVPDDIYPRFYEVEDTMLEIIRKNDFR